MTKTVVSGIRTNFGRPAFWGLLFVIVLLGACVAWSAMARVAGAVIASGTVGVSGKPKTIQHLDGGIVAKIHVAAGDVVEEGESLIELDGSTISANLEIYKRRLREALVRKQRLLTEMSKEAEISAIDPDISEQFDLGDAGVETRQQHKLLMARREARVGEIEQLNKRIEQFKMQIVGVEQLRKAKERQQRVYDKERKAIESLVKKELAARNQLLVFDRNEADLDGQIAEHSAEIGRLRNSISEVEISKLQIDRQFHEKVTEEYEQNEASIGDLMQQVEATGQQLRRTNIKSPVAGIVHEIITHTIGGVVQAGQAVMQIIPQSGRFEIEVNVETTSIDQIALGREAIVRFPAFHESTTPELLGKVVRISPSSVVDEKSGFSFYRVGIEMEDNERKKLGKNELVPGMPVEALMPTSERTVLEHLIKPLLDQLKYVFKEG